MIVLGLDVSTSCTGYCIVEKTDYSYRIVDAGFLNLKKHDTFFKKSMALKDFLIEISKKNSIESIAIEENLQSFRPGMSSAKTLLSLAKFNGVSCLFSEDIFSIQPTMVSVVRARSKLGIKINRKLDLNTKQQVLAWVKKHPIFINYEWPQKKLKQGPRRGMVIDDPACYDIADAAVVCLSILD